MKTFPIVILLLLVVNPFQSLGNDNLDAEKKAIRSVIEKERNAFYSADLEGQLKAWGNQPYVVRMMSSGSRMASWDSVYNFLKTAFSDSVDILQNIKVDLLDENVVVKGSAAAEAGIKEYDIILEVMGEKVTDKNPLDNVLQKYKIGQEVSMKILRDKKQITLKAKLREKK